MKLLIDANVLLDVLQNRRKTYLVLQRPHFPDDAWAKS